MLGFDVGAGELAGFVAGKEDDASCFFRVPLEHGRPSQFQVARSILLEPFQSCVIGLVSLLDPPRPRASALKTLGFKTCRGTSELLTNTSPARLNVGPLCRRVFESKAGSITHHPFT